MKRILNVGDEVWVARAVWSSIPTPCPVCAGTTKLLVKPNGAPDTDGTVVECDYCKRHTIEHPPAGTVVNEWAWKPQTQKIQIERVVTSIGKNGAEPEYHYNVTTCSCNTLREPWFDTQEEAQSKAEEMAAKADADSIANRMDVICNNRERNKGYTVGYHKSNIRELEKKLKWHQAQIETYKKQE